jgi:hypothetical protein
MTTIDYARRAGSLQGALRSACITLEIYGLREDIPSHCRIRIEREIAAINALLAEQFGETESLLSELTLADMPDAKAA